jgi:hypothetical protein
MYQLTARERGSTSAVTLPYTLLLLSVANASTQDMLTLSGRNRAPSM